MPSFLKLVKETRDVDSFGHESIYVPRTRRTPEMTQQHRNQWGHTQQNNINSTNHTHTRAVLGSNEVKVTRYCVKVTFIYF